MILRNRILLRDLRGLVLNELLQHGHRISAQSRYNSHSTHRFWPISYLPDPVGFFDLYF